MELTQSKSTTVLLLWFMCYIYIYPTFKFFSYFGYSLRFYLPLITTVLLLVYTFIKLKEKKTYYFPLLPTIYFILVSFSILWSFTYINEYPLIVGNDNAIITSKEYLFSFLKNNYLYFVMFSLIGIDINNIISRLEKNIWKIALYIAYFNVVFFVFFISMKTGKSLFDTIFLANKENTYYLVLGDVFLIITIFIKSMSTSREKIIHFFLDLISVIVLMKIGSRTSLVSFIFLLIVTYIYKLRVKKTDIKKLFWLTVSLIFCVLFIIQIQIFFNNATIFLQNIDERIISIVNITTDSSWNSRTLFSKANFDDLQNIWFFGEFLRELYVHQHVGYYTHNIISHWISFGIVPFILLISYILKKLYIVFVSFLHGKEYKYYHSFVIFIGLLPAVLFSRSYIFTYFWLFLFSMDKLILKESVNNEK